MKTKSIRHHLALSLIGCAAAALLVPGAAAQATRSTDAGTVRSPAPGQVDTDRAAGERQRDPQATRSRSERPQSQLEPGQAMSRGQRAREGEPRQGREIRVTRASNYLGTDVISTDDRKVGDIVDFYFDLSSASYLEYVVIMTGGFLNMGGDTRAVPASALTLSGDTARISMSSDDFWDVPVLPGNRQRFLSDPQHRQRLAQLFQDAERTARPDTARAPGETPTGRDTPDTRRPMTADRAPDAADRTQDPNRAGAMTGRPTGQQEPRLVSFSELRNADAYSQEDTRLGFFQDVWISLNENRAPYVEITPTFQPFRTDFDRRYAVPMAKLGERREYAGYTVEVTTDELNEAESVTETEGVRMLEEGRFGETVLRVTVPRR
jgi:hypothetical protein